MDTMIKNIYQINEQALMCDFGDNINKKINSNVISLFNYLNKYFVNKKLGIKNCVPSYNKLLIHYDLSQTNYKEMFDLINELSKKQLSKHDNKELIILPVCYDKEFSLDLQNIAKKINLTTDEIIDLHLSTQFYVYMIGFMPGLAFVGDLNKKLYSSRLKTPRLSVPACSVAIVEKFCTIYPNESPGGWNIIGRTPQKLFFKEKKEPSLLKPGTTIKFQRISKSEFFKLESKSNE